jgi:solute carrier family 25 aspartate/glutamate transporter 12/13
MAVGAVSGVLGTVAIFPIDTVKTRLQLAAVQSNAGIRGIIRDVLGRYGPRGFYRGLPPTAVFVAPEKAIKLGVNDYLRDVLCGWDRTKETVLQQIAAGALTACVQVIVTNVSRVEPIRFDMCVFFLGGEKPIQTHSKILISNTFIPFASLANGNCQASIAKRRDLPNTLRSDQ